MPLTIMRAWRLASLDIAVLAVGIPAEWPDDHRWVFPMVDLLPPPVGTSIAAFGFPDSQFRAHHADGPPILNMSPSSSTGEVLEIHHQARDASRLPVPCFRTNARFDGGMSGGPVFNNQTGHVCGVVCSSIPATTTEDEHISYASTIWPVLGTPVDASESGPSGATPYPLMNLYASGVLRARGMEHLRLDGKQVSATYDAKRWNEGRSG